MPGLLPRALGRSAGDPSFTIFLVTVACACLRSVDLPAVDIGVLDVTLRRRRAAHHRRPRRPPAAAPAFAVARGCSSRRRRSARLSSRLVARERLATRSLRPASSSSSALLGLGAAVLIDSPQRLRALLVLVVVLRGGRDRLGARRLPHVGSGAPGVVHGRARPRRPRDARRRDRARARPRAPRQSPACSRITGLVIGVIGTILGAALASLIGLYLASVVVLLLARRRGDLRWTAALVTLAVAGLSTAGHCRAPGRRPRLPPVVVRPAAGASRPVRRELEPAADLRLHRRPRLSRPAGARDRLARAAAAGGVRPLPPRRARAVPGPAGALLPARRRGLHPAAGLRPGALRARPRRRGVLAVLLALAGWRAAVAARRRDPDAAYIPAMWLAAVLGAIAGAALFGGSPLTAMFWLIARRRRCGDRVAGDAHEDRARDRTAQCRRRRAACPPDRACTAAAGARRHRRRRHARHRRGVDGVHRRRARDARAQAAGAAAAAFAASRTPRRSSASARSSGGNAPTSCTRTRQRPAPRAGWRRCSRAARGHARSSTPTTATS